MSRSAYGSPGKDRVVRRWQRIETAARDVVIAESVYEDALEQQYPGVDIEEHARGFWDSVKRLREALEEIR